MEAFPTLLPASMGDANLWALKNHPTLYLLFFITIISLGPFLVALLNYHRLTLTITLSAITGTLTVIIYSLLIGSMQLFSTFTIHIFIIRLLIWIFTFHWLAYHLGYYPKTYYNDKRWMKNWVKEIDYVYLSISALSLLKLVITQISPHEELSGYNALAAVALGIALALRITKTSVEVWGWDEPATV